MTLTWSLRSRVMGFAHHLSEWNIMLKFNENRSKGSGDTVNLVLVRTVKE